MKTLIVPCAGKSSRFEGLRPKWLLTHPDGKLMVAKAIEGLPLDKFGRIIITYVRPHDEEYDAGLMLSQVFRDNPKISFCMLDGFTSSACETVSLTLKKMRVSGPFTVKDSDNYVCIDLAEGPENSVAGVSLNSHPEISRVAEKSFLKTDENNYLLDIVEKKVVSDIIGIGVYSFESAEVFEKNYAEMLKSPRKTGREMYISDIISHMIAGGTRFLCRMAEEYEDWGTLSEWRKVQGRFRSYFVDVDGVLVKNCGKYGKVNWYNNKEILSENFEVLRQLQREGAQIIICTSRTEECRSALEEMLSAQDIHPHAIIMGVNHAMRVMINDFAPTNPYPSSMAVTFPRNGRLKDYLF